MTRRELGRRETVELALICGFMLHSGYGQNSDKMMPVSDTETLMRFAQMVLDNYREAEFARLWELSP